MKTFAILFFTLVLKHDIHSQSAYKSLPVYYLGVGAGLPYGGLGINALLKPHKNFGLFAGGGYNFLKFGFNGGIKYSFTPKDDAKRWVPYLIGMYGYNAVINVQFSTTLQGFPAYFTYKRVYWGASFGGGADLKTKKANGNFWSFAFFVPVRDPDFRRSYDTYKNLGASFTFPPSPIVLSAGFHVAL